MVQELRPAAVQPQTTSLREQRNAEAEQCAAGGCRRVQMQGDGAAQQDGEPERSRSRER